jgi:uncharacterized protein YkwD
MRLLIPTILALLCLVYPPRAADGGDKEKEPDKGGPFKLTEAEQKLLDLTNAERKQHKLPPLKASPLLFSIARAHSANMARQNKAAHTLDGKDQFQRLKDAGYDYASAGENIADGNVELEEVMKGWMGSKAHRANLLHPRYTEIGLGMALAGKDTTYYTQLFGRPMAGGKQDPDRPTADEQTVIDRINDMRKEEKLPPLKASNKLTGIARAHSENMAKQRKLDHVLDGKKPGDRLKEGGYKFQFYGENVYYSPGKRQKVVEDVVPSWMKSPPHRGNILLKQVTEVGIGMAVDDRGWIYFTAVFAHPSR